MGSGEEWKRAGFVITTDPAKIDVDATHEFLSQKGYWAEGVPREIVARSIENSLCFAIFDTSNPDGNKQIGFARAISDFATYAYLADVYVLEPYRGRGLSKWLMEVIMAHPKLQGLRRWNLVTRDAHGLYEQFGFTRTANPERYMELLKRDAYKKVESNG